MNPVAPSVAADPVSVAGSPGNLGGRADFDIGEARFTQARIERILWFVIALGTVVLGTQSFLNALGSHQESTGWHHALLTLAFVPIGLMVVALAVPFLPRAAARVCAVALLVVFACWPFATADIPVDPTEQPWIWYLLNIATTAAVVGFALPLQVTWAIAVPVLYATVRLVQVGTVRDDVIAVLLDAAFAMTLAGLIIGIGWMMRTLAVGIDRARADVVASSAAVAEADAAEAERVAVAALMHDSVLAALIAAERAASPREEALAAAMAREALTRLANADQDVGEGPDEEVPAASLVRAVERAVAGLDETVPVAVTVSPRAVVTPGRTARAIVLATTQAAANALQHAGGRGLAIEMTVDAAAVRVRVVDTGPGFDPGAVAADRLGIRGSIVARMAAAGGAARVQTGPGGTAVRLEWTAPLDGEAPR